MLIYVDYFLNLSLVTASVALIGAWAFSTATVPPTPTLRKVHAAIVVATISTVITAIGFGLQLTLVALVAPPDTVPISIWVNRCVAAAFYSVPLAGLPGTATALTAMSLTTRQRKAGTVCVAICSLLLVDALTAGINRQSPSSSTRWLLVIGSDVLGGAALGLILAMTVEHVLARFGGGLHGGGRSFNWMRAGRIGLAATGFVSGTFFLFFWVPDHRVFLKCDDWHTLIFRYDRTQTESFRDTNVVPLYFETDMCFAQLSELPRPGAAVGPDTLCIMVDRDGRDQSLSGSDVKVLCRVRSRSTDDATVDSVKRHIELPDTVWVTGSTLSTQITCDVPKGHGLVVARVPPTCVVRLSDDLSSLTGTVVVLDDPDNALPATATKPRRVYARIDDGAFIRAIVPGAVRVGVWPAHGQEIRVSDDICSCCGCIDEHASVGEESARWPELWVRLDDLKTRKVVDIPQPVRFFCVADPVVRLAASTENEVNLAAVLVAPVSGTLALGRERIDLHEGDRVDIRGNKLRVKTGSRNQFVIEGRASRVVLNDEAVTRNAWRRIPREIRATVIGSLIAIVGTLSLSKRPRRRNRRKQR